MCKRTRHRNPFCGILHLPEDTKANPGIQHYSYWVSTSATTRSRTSKAIAAPHPSTTSGFLHGSSEAVAALCTTAEVTFNLTSPLLMSSSWSKVSRLFTSASAQSAAYRQRTRLHGVSLSLCQDVHQAELCTLSTLAAVGRPVLVWWANCGFCSFFAAYIMILGTWWAGQLWSVEHARAFKPCASLFASGKDWKGLNSEREFRSAMWKFSAQNLRNSAPTAHVSAGLSSSRNANLRKTRNVLVWIYSTKVWLLFICRGLGSSFKRRPIQSFSNALKIR